MNGSLLLRLQGSSKVTVRSHCYGFCWEINMFRDIVSGVCAHSMMCMLHSSASSKTEGQSSSFLTLLELQAFSTIWVLETLQRRFRSLRNFVPMIVTQLWKISFFCFFQLISLIFKMISHSLLRHDGEKIMAYQCCYSIIYSQQSNWFTFLHSAESDTRRGNVVYEWLSCVKQLVTWFA